MFVLRCDECGELMHRVGSVTPKTVQVGLNQLAYHMFAEHTLERFEQLLAYTGGLVVSGKVDISRLEKITAPICPNCKDEVTEDSYRYVREPGRTRLCCSQVCLDAVNK